MKVLYFSLFVFTSCFAIIFAVITVLSFATLCALLTILSATGALITHDLYKEKENES